jgi:hypothetical protein
VARLIELAVARQQPTAQISGQPGVQLRSVLGDAPCYVPSASNDPGGTHEQPSQPEEGEPSWFTVEGTNTSAKALLAGTGEVTVAPGKAVLPEATFKLSFKEEPTNQSGCEKAGLTIAFKLHAS